MSNKQSELESRFKGAARKPSQVEEIASNSIIEAHQKEARLLQFYEQPLGPNSEPWHLAKIYWQYLRAFKTEGTKRKDGATESIIHELDPCLYAKALLEAGFLPKEVTSQNIYGEHITLPPEQHSIENFFSSYAIHDMDEDNPDYSRKTLIEFGQDHISDIRSILKTAQEDLMRKQIAFIADVSDAVTFGRKTRLPNGDIVKENTHNNNFPTCFRAMKKLWPAISLKALDRLGGLVTRFSRVPVASMTPQNNMNYLDETRELFMTSQPIEDTQDRFPQLSEYLDIVNMNLRIALVTLDSAIQYHPQLNEKYFQTRGTRDPNALELSVHRQLPVAMRAAKWLTPDICPMTCLLEGLIAEAERYPKINPVVEQFEKQAVPYLTQLKQIKNLGPNSSLKITPNLGKILK